MAARRARSLAFAVQLEREPGIPRNPFINTGAIMVTDADLAGRGLKATIAEILETVHTPAGDPNVTKDSEVARSKADTGYRAGSMANFMCAYRSITNPMDCVLETCWNQCALRVNCVQLKRAGLFMASGAVDPTAGGVWSMRRWRGASLQS